MKFFSRIYEYFFYDPYEILKKQNNIKVSADTVLLKTCRFRFERKVNNNRVSIGSNSMIGANFIFESDQGKISIGDKCFINDGTNLISRSSISIGNHVTIAWGCTIYDHNSHSLDFLERQRDMDRQLDDFRAGKSFISSKDWSVVKSRPIVIENNVWIGFNSIILSGVTIGEGAIIGAKSVVRDNVEPWTIVAGNPAVVVKRLK